MGKKLHKSSNKTIAGVCGGFAEYFGMDYAIVRILYAFLTLVTGIGLGVVLYIVCLIVMEEDNTIE